jgi:hypothetical protein
MNLSRVLATQAQGPMFNSSTRNKQTKPELRPILNSLFHLSKEHINEGEKVHQTKQNKKQKS